MTEPLLVYALTKINVGRGDPDRQDRADQRPYTGLDILAVKCTDHADPVTHKLIGEIRVTFVATGAVVYLPLPAGYADVGHTAVPAGYALAVDDEPETPAVQVADDLTGLNIKALKALATDLGLSVGGTKAQLIARIGEHKTDAG